MTKVLNPLPLRNMAFLLLRDHLDPDEIQRRLHDTPQIIDDQWLVALLEAVGFHARFSRLEGDDLRFLQLPLFLIMGTEGGIVIYKIRGQHLLVRDTDGQRWLKKSLVTGHADLRVLIMEQKAEGPLTLFGMLLKDFSKHRRELVLLILGTFCIAACTLAQPLLTIVIVNRALPDDSINELWLIGLSIVFLSLFRSWNQYLRERTLLYLITRAERITQKSFLLHVLKLPFSTLQTYKFSSLLEGYGGLRIGREILSERLFSTLLDSAILIWYFVAILFLVPQMLLVVAAAAFIALLMSIISAKLQTHWQRYEVQFHSDQQGYLAEAMIGIQTIKMAGSENRVANRWKGLLGKELKVGLSRRTISLYTDVAITAYNLFLNSAFLIGAAWLAMRGTIQSGTLIGFLQIALGLLGTITNLVKAATDITLLRPFLKTTYSLLLQPTLAEPSTAPEHRLTHVPDIFMEDVWFRYSESSPWILQGYNLAVSSQEVHVLRGASGSGKSTILRLLAGLYVPDRGRVMIGGRDPHAAQTEILYLPQAVKLYSGSVKENLKLLSGGAPFDEIVHAAAQTGMDELVESLPMRYETVLVSGGLNFSGGQRQLLALTAMIASRRKVLLLDEAMANMDGLKIERCSSALRNIASTVICATHTSAENKAALG